MILLILVMFILLQIHQITGVVEVPEAVVEEAEAVEVVVTDMVLHLV